MNDHGFEFGQAGSDITLSPDYQKIIDSSFPYIDYTSHDIDVTVTDAAWVPVLKHNKGFLPGYFFKDLDAEWDALNSRPYLAADETYVYMRGDSFFSPNTRIRAVIEMTDVEITKEYLAPIESITNVREYDETEVGIKFLKDEAPKDIGSSDFRNFSVHTKMKSFSIHQTGTDTGTFGNAYTLTIRHLLGYHPIFFIARVDTVGREVNYLPSQPSSRMVAPLGNVGGKMRATNTEIEISGTQSALEGEYAYLVLKDPIAGIG